MLTSLKRAAAKIIRRGKNSPSAKKTRGDDFEAYKREHPGATFAQFYVADALQTIREGKAHSTLGLRLYDKPGSAAGERDYFKAGSAASLRYRRLGQMHSSNRVVDYGCGSLRLGIHFIEFLAPRNYMGLDVTSDFFEMGVSASPELIAQKEPHLFAIDGISLRKAAEFGADFVISNAVSYHVPPEETGTYYRNLAQICSKPGARLFLDAKLSDAPIQFRKKGWAYPRSFYVEQLKPLTFVKQHGTSAVKDQRSDAAVLESAILEFRRD